MKFFLGIAFLLAAPASFAAEQAAANQAPSVREMVHCASLFQMLGRYSDGDYKNRYEFASAALLREASKSSSASEIQGWMNEYFSQSPPKSAGAEAFLAYLDQSNIACAPLANTVIKSALDRLGPEASKDNRITTRYPSNRPEAALIFGKNVSFSDSDGLSCEAPIVFSGTEDSEARIRAQYVWLEDRRPGWKVDSHATSFSEVAPSREALERTKIYSTFKMITPDGQPNTVCFDTTASAKASLLRAAGK